MYVLPLPADRIVITKHADERLHKRAPDLDLDAARDEIAEAITAGRYQWRAKNIWYAWTAQFDRNYVFAYRRGRLVVITVLAAGEAA